MMHLLRFRDAVTWLEMDMDKLADCDLQQRMMEYAIENLAREQWTKEEYDLAMRLAGDNGASTKHTAFEARQAELRRARREQRERNVKARGD